MNRVPILKWWFHSIWLGASISACLLAPTGCARKPQDRSKPFCEQRGVDALGPTYRAICWDTVDNLPQVAVCPEPWKTHPDSFQLARLDSPECVDDHAHAGRGRYPVCPGDADPKCVPIEEVVGRETEAQTVQPNSLHLPVVGDMANLGKIATDPKFREKVANDPKMQKILEHPKIKHLLADQALISAARRNDIASILANPRLNAALEDPEVRKLLSEVDLSGGE